ncbi:MAG: ferrous iron transporter B, partial [Acidobacteria bacterium]|nr:ferrous iron transporter B [Acidobacteriota bacterium]
MQPSPSPAAPPLQVASDRPKIALIGNPNTGKTTLFNRLCGLRAKTSNFPGTTTDARRGRWLLGGAEPLELEVVDLPGLYRVQLDRPESQVVSQVLRGQGLYRKPNALVIVVDATNLLRNLHLVAELLAFDLPTVVVLNMVDLAQRRGLTVDTQRLGQLLGCPVIPTIARGGIGIEALETAVREALGPAARPSRQLPLPSPRDAGALAAWADRVIEDSVGGREAVGSSSDTLDERLDEAFTHPVLGVVAFLGIMGGLFWTLFSLAKVPMDLIEAIFEHLGGWLQASLPAGPVREMLVDGIVGG